jgi:hypothetical protein
MQDFTRYEIIAVEYTVIYDTGIIYRTNIISTREIPCLTQLVKICNPKVHDYVYKSARCIIYWAKWI